MLLDLHESFPVSSPCNCIDYVSCYPLVDCALVLWHEIAITSEDGTDESIFGAKITRDGVTDGPVPLLSGADPVLFSVGHEPHIVSQRRVGQKTNLVSLSICSFADDSTNWTAHEVSSWEVEALSSHIFPVFFAGRLAFFYVSHSGRSIEMVLCAEDLSVSDQRIIMETEKDIFDFVAVPACDDVVILMSVGGELLGAVTHPDKTTNPSSPTIKIPYEERVGRFDATFVSGRIAVIAELGNASFYDVALSSITPGGEQLFPWRRIANHALMPTVHGLQDRLLLGYTGGALSRACAWRLQDYDLKSRIDPAIEEQLPESEIRTSTTPAVWAAVSDMNGFLGADPEPVYVGSTVDVWDLQLAVSGSEVMALWRYGEDQSNCEIMGRAFGIL